MLKLICPCECHHKKDSGNCDSKTYPYLVEEMKWRGLNFAKQGERPPMGCQYLLCPLFIVTEVLKK